MTRAALGVELRKLSAQPALILAVALCTLGPFAVAVVVHAQSGTPADTLFGADVHESGIALSLVVLSFSGQWGIPLLCGIIAGDVFSAEDRHGTWKTLLLRDAPLPAIYAAKLLAAAVVMLGLVALLAVASIVASVAVLGTGTLIGLGGTELSSGHALALTAVAWLGAIPPTLAYTAVALLLSLALRSGIIAVLGPLLVALLTQLADLVGHGVLVHFAMPGAAFSAWPGLFASPQITAPLLITLAVALAWVTALTASGWLVARGRPLAVPQRLAVRVPITAVLVALVVVGAATQLGPSGVTAPRLQAAIGRTFERLTALQQQRLGHPIATDAQRVVVAACRRSGSAQRGPGDWSCTINLYLRRPGQQATVTPVDYDVSVQASGCFKVTSPPAFIGGPRLNAPGGRHPLNPLFVFYGCFSVL